MLTRLVLDDILPTLGVDRRVEWPCRRVPFSVFFSSTSSCAGVVIDYRMVDFGNTASTRIPGRQLSSMLQGLEEACHVCAVCNLYELVSRRRRRRGGQPLDVGLRALCGHHDLSTWYYSLPARGRACEWPRLHFVPTECPSESPHHFATAEPTLSWREDRG